MRPGTHTAPPCRPSLVGSPHGVASPAARHREFNPAKCTGLGESTLLPLEEILWLFHHVIKAALWQLKISEVNAVSAPPGTLPAPLAPWARVADIPRPALKLREENRRELRTAMGRFGCCQSWQVCEVTPEGAEAEEH